MSKTNVLKLIIYFVCKICKATSHYRFNINTVNDVAAAVVVEVWSSRKWSSKVQLSQHNTWINILYVQMRDCKPIHSHLTVYSGDVCGLEQINNWNPVGPWNLIKSCSMASFLCIWGPFDMKMLERVLEGGTGRGHVGGRGFEAGPFMSAVIIVRLKVGHTLWACSHKEQECSHCEGRLAGWEYYVRAELCRARHGQEHLLPLPHSYVLADNMWYWASCKNPWYEQISS